MVGLMSPIRPHVIHDDFVPRAEVLVTPPNGMCDVANEPICQPLFILSCALKRWDPLEDLRDASNHPTFG